MPVHDFTSQRLFVDTPLSAGARIACTPNQANYLGNVLRLAPGAAILVFNGRDGEWRAKLIEQSKRGCALEAEAQLRAQEAGPDIDYYFAPLKRARLDYMVQKATELGVARLGPVLTRHTIAERVNADRMRANVIEAAEQCGILRLPDILETRKLGPLLEAWEGTRPLVFCDERAPVTSPLAALSQFEPGGPLAVLIGPEGGFADAERALLAKLPFAVPISLGPRIMRADTAAVAALALINAAAGDWR